MLNMDNKVNKFVMVFDLNILLIKRSYPGGIAPFLLCLPTFHDSDQLNKTYVLQRQIIHNNLTTN